VSDVGDAVSAAVTVKVTGTVSVPLELPHELVGLQVTTTDPLYVPVGRPLKTPATIETVSLPGVEPLLGETASQLPPLVVEAVTL
jgi:hypothetical protein